MMNFGAHSRVFVARWPRSLCRLESLRHAGRFRFAVCVCLSFRKPLVCHILPALPAATFSPEEEPAAARLMAILAS